MIIANNFSRENVSNCWFTVITKNKQTNKDLGGPVQAGDDTMLGPTLVHELPVEREFCTGLDFTGGVEKTKHHKSIKALLQKNQLQV